MSSRKIINSLKKKKATNSNNLDDSNLVCDIQSIIIGSQPNVCLLSPIRPAIVVQSMKSLYELTLYEMNNNPHC